jgi:hypothetical protein
LRVPRLCLSYSLLFNLSDAFFSAIYSSIMLSRSAFSSAKRFSECTQARTGEGEGEGGGEGEAVVMSRALVKKGV